MRKDISYQLIDDRIHRHSNSFSIFIECDISCDMNKALMRFSLPYKYRLYYVDLSDIMEYFIFFFDLRGRKFEN